MHYNRSIVFYCLLLTVYCLLFLPACSDDKAKQPLTAASVPVTVGAVVRKPVPVQVRAIGNVEAYSTVGIKSQVGGALMRVHFKEGQDVNKGDLLFTIDPRPYEAALKQAEANLAKDNAQLENARVGVRRYAELVKKGYVAQEQYDQIRTTSDVLEAAVNADRAVVENAQLQLKYCYIYSPLTGRTGSLITNEGNLIKANDVQMVVINQVQPLYVNFSVPEQDLSEIKKYVSGGKLKAWAFLSNDDKDPEEGVLTFIDNSVDIATGTIKLKASFANKDKRLWPGQFVNVIMTLRTLPDAIVVPAPAVQTGQQGQFVFVVKEGLAELRPVTVGITYKDIMVVESGLVPGEQVVTDGQMRLMPGAKVEIKKMD
jgi:multidrug efflux system membrane fusion protein